MIIKSLKLTNFRNHATYSLACTDETSLILGPNGSGKTSVLEAIYLLTRGKSFRATDPDIIKRDTDFYRAELEFTSGKNHIATYDRTHKTFLIEDKKYRRLPRQHQYPIILFEPSDLNLLTHSPSRRRTYFDRFFSQLNPAYATSLSKYEKALKQLNQLLKSENLTRDAVFSWNILLAKYGIALYNFRSEFVAEINSRLTTTYYSIAQVDDQITLRYQTELSPSSPDSQPVPPTEQSYLNILEQNFEKDHYLGHTTFGIHRDDYIFEFNHELADGSASRGESRTIILALKFIEAELIYQKTSLRPLILLDDVFSELDTTRRTSLIQNFKNHQVIITSVEDVSLD